MLSQKDIQLLIEGCRATAKIGLGTGVKATIQELAIDFLSPPMDFLGLTTNPAIFVNEETYHLLGKFHKSWVSNGTIAVKESFLKEPTLQIIGIIVHETGHAFNVAAGISNSEANAYIFEIEVLSRWLHQNNTLLYGSNSSDLLKYFNSRLEEYHKSMSGSPYLSQLVKQIEHGTIPCDPEKENTPLLQPKLKRSRSDSSHVVHGGKKISRGIPGFFGEATYSHLTVRFEAQCTFFRTVICIDEKEKHLKSSCIML